MPVALPAPRAARPWRFVPLLLALAACTPKAERAAQYEAMADQMMTVQAYPAAVGALQRALKLDANNADRWIKMARAERMMGHDALAATAYQRTVELAPDNVEALQALSVLLVRGGQVELAKQYITTLMSLSPDDIGGLLAQGAIALREHRLIDADHLADQLIKLAPTLTDGYILKARVIEMRGDPRAAAALLTARLKLDPDNPDLATQVLRLSRLSGNREAVRDVSLTLARLVPNDPRYQLEAARTLRARGDVAGADDILAKLQQRYIANLQVMLGLAHEWSGFLPRAEALDRIVRLAQAAPGHSKAALATLLVQSGAAQRALDVLRPALGSKVDSDTVDARAAYANAQLALGQLPQATSGAEEVLAFDYRNTDALLVRAKLSGMRRDFSHALDDAQLVMSQDPLNAEAALLVARLWAQQGNAVLADKAFGTAQDRFPNDLAIHRERIAFLIGQNRAGDAASLATSFANQHGGSAEAVQLMATACKAAEDVLCSADARRRLARG